MTPQKARYRLPSQLWTLDEWTQAASYYSSGAFIAGDAAYVLTEHLLVPFTGSCKEDADKDSYNFYLSQLRIRIEMAFGLLTTKWHILRRKLERSLTNSSRILEACARMHNYVLNCNDQEDNPDSPQDEPEIHALAGSPLGWGYLPTVQDFSSLAGISHTHNTVVRKITREGLRCPAHNVERRTLKLDDLGLM
jgi:hypothetical protein